MFPTLTLWGDQTISSYLIMDLIGLLVFAVLFIYALSKTKLPRSTASIVALITVACGIVGAHLAETNLRVEGFSKVIFSSPLNILGGTIMGGILGALLSLFIASRVKSISFLALLDLLVPPGAAALGFAKIGCFAKGCCLGNVALQTPWGMQFPISELPLHPVQLYESILGFMTASIGFWLLRRKQTNGSVGLVCLSIYLTGRFLIDYVRLFNGNRIAGFTTMQILALIAVPLCLVCLVMIQKARNV